MNHWTALVDPQAAIPQAGPGVRHMPLGDWGVQPEPKPRPTTSKKRNKPSRPRDEWLAGRWKNSYRYALLMLLLDGAMDRADFRKKADALYDGSDESGVSQTIKKLLSDGLIRCEVSLTPEGLRKLGLKGPQ